MAEWDAWFTSSFSNGGNCVQIKLTEGALVRDSKDPAGPVLRFSPSEWTAFLAGVRSGEFDLPQVPSTEPDGA